MEKEKQTAQEGITKEFIPIQKQIERGILSLGKYSYNYDPLINQETIPKYQSQYKFFVSEFFN